MKVTGGVGRVLVHRVCGRLVYVCILDFIWMYTLLVYHVDLISKSV